MAKSEAGFCLFGELACRSSPKKRRRLVANFWVQGSISAHVAVVVKTVLGSHVGVGEFTTHVSWDFSGDWDVHWGTGF